MSIGLDLSFAGADPTKKQAAAWTREASPLRQIVEADPEDAKTIIAAGSNLFDIARRARQPYQDGWSEFYDWARGNHWDSRRPVWRSHAKSNYIFAALFQRAALLTDSRPILRAVPRNKRQVKVVNQIVNPMLEYLWEVQGMDATLIELVIGTVMLGTYYLKPGYDEYACDGDGELITSAVDPNYVWPDPGAVSVNGPDGGEFIWHVEPRSLEWFERNFEDGWKVAPEDIPADLFGPSVAGRKLSNKSPVDEKPGLRGLPIIGPLFGRRGSGHDPLLLGDIPRALCFELWIRDSTVEGPDEDNLRERFPNGRKIIFANGVMLTPSDEHQQSEFAGGRFPLIRFRNYTWPGEFHGGSDVEQTWPIQQEMNISRARIADHMANFTNGKWIVQKDSGIDPNTLSNSPTQIVQPRRMDQVKRLDGLPLPEGIIQHQAMLQKDFENISASREVDQGRVPDRISSGLAIQELKEASQTRVRLTERSLKESLEELCPFWVELVRKYYPRRRIARVTDEAGRVSQFIDIKPSEIPQRLDYIAQVGSQILKGQQRVSTNDSIELYNAGLIDQQAALEAIDFPQSKEVMLRMEGDRNKLMNLLKSNPRFKQAVIEELQAGQGQGG